MSNSFAFPCIVALQAPLSMGFSRQEYCTGFPWPSPGDLPDPGIEPVSPALQVNSLPLSYREGRGPQEALMELPGKGKELPLFWGPRALLQLSCTNHIPTASQTQTALAETGSSAPWPGGPRGPGGATRVPAPDQQVPHRLGVQR